MSKKTVKFSIVIPTFNEEKTIERTLKAVRNQTFKDFEIIVKDGGSTDKTVNLAKKYADKVVCKSDSSVAEARNQGAEYARGVFIVFVDADTELPTGTLERFANLIRGGKIIAGSCRKVPRNGTVSDRIFYEFVNITTWMSYYLYIGGAHGNCMFIQRNVFKTLNGFNPKLRVGEETELVRKIKRTGRFTFLLDTYVLESTRRIQAWGKLKLYATWLVGTYRSFAISKPQEYEKVR